MEAPFNESRQCVYRICTHVEVARSGQASNAPFRVLFQPQVLTRMHVEMYMHETSSQNMGLRDKRYMARHHSFPL